MVRTLGLRLTNPFRRYCPPAPGQAEPPMPRAPEQVAHRATAANGAKNICGSAPSLPTDPAAAFVLGAVHIGAGVGLIWLAGAAALFQASREMMEV